jgi:hypothetical protein
MRMKNSFLIALLAFSVSAFAQGKDEAAVIREMYGKAKKDLVGSYMGLPEAKAAPFWEVYNAYETDRKSLADTRMMLIGNYIDKYKTLNDAEADVLAKNMLSNNLDYDKLNSKYYKKMKKVLGPLDAAKFIQLENYIQTGIRNELQNALPLIGEIDRKKK